MIRSIFQACRKEMKRLCAGNMNLACLVEKKSNITDQQCEAWLDARAACLQDVKTAKCQLPFLQCVVKIPEKDLSAACKDSDFYKSTKLRVRRFAPRKVKPVDGAAGKPQN